MARVPTLRSACLRVVALVTTATLVAVAGSKPAQSTTQIIAMSGDPAPDGNGQFSSLYGVISIPPTLNNSGQVAFFGTLSGTTGGTTDNTGIFLRSSGALTQVARKGQSAPDGVGTFLQLGGYRINDAGQVAFSASTGPEGQWYESGVYLASSGSVAQIAHFGQPLPNGNEQIAATWLWALNNAGQILFEANVRDSVTGDGFGNALFVSHNNSFTEIVRDGEPTPDGQGQFTSSYRPVMNNHGDVAFWSPAEYPFSHGGGIYLASGGSIQQIMLKPQPAPDGNGIFTGSASGWLSVNDAAQVAFHGWLGQTSGIEYDEEGIFLGTANEVSQVIRAGELVPGGNGRFDWMEFPKINNAGQIAVTAGVIVTNGTTHYVDGLFLYSDGSLSEVVRGGQPAPDGNGLLGGIRAFPAFNDAGQILFQAQLTQTSGGESDNHAIYLATANGIHQVARKGQLLAGSPIIDLLLSDSMHHENGPNNFGQVVYWAKLADGRDVIALWTPPFEGDFNNDGHVDSADYVLLRKTNAPQTYFEVWRLNFGRTGEGSVADAAIVAAVPEPASVVLAFLVGALWAVRFRRQRPC